MTTYENYKDSGIEWLGEVPEHWKILRIKDFVTSVIDTEHKTVPFHIDGKYLVLRTSNIRNARISLNNAKYTDEAGFTEWTKRGKPIEKDVIITREAPAGEAVVVPNKPVLCLGQRTVLLKPIHNIISSPLIVYNFYGEAINKFIKTHSNGSTVSHLNMREIPNIAISFPESLQEQTQIANYLDQQTRLIDQKIDLLTQKIKHYQDLKTAIINRAVTKGLDDTVEMKDSGVEWIGEIPTHWEVKRIKDVSFLQFSNVDKKKYEGEKEVVLCNYTDVYKNDLITENMPFMKATASEHEIKKFQIRNDDVIFTKDSESFDDVANPALVVIKEKEIICSYHLALVRPNQEDILGAFIFRLLQSRDYNISFCMIAKGVTRVGIGLQNCKNLKIVVPPLLEQQKIIEHLNHKAITIDKIIETITTQITHQKELRKTLINDVVTGKVKVTST